MDFSNKTAIVTGAANGIGKGIALHYAMKGANVVVADIDEEAGKEIVSLIKEQGRNAFYVKTDVRCEDDIIRLMEITFQTYGQIDILINNAGKGLFKSPYDLSLEEWDDLLNTNLRSVFLCSREQQNICVKIEMVALLSILPPQEQLCLNQILRLMLLPKVELLLLPMP